MSFKDYRSDQKLIERIGNAARSDSVSHAYIFEGDTTVDLTKFSLDFIKAVLCEEEKGVGCGRCVMCRKVDHGNLEDLYIVEAEYNSGKTVKSVRDDAVAELQTKLKTKPNLTRNIALIKDADTLTLRAQNRLLKTLEEPTPGTVIILLSNNSENLLDTVRSRAVKYHVYGDITDESDLTYANELFNLIFENADFFTLKESLQKHIKNRDDAFYLLDSLEKVARNVIVNDSSMMEKKRERIIESITYIEEARRDLIYKVSFMNALKNLILKI